MTIRDARRQSVTDTNSKAVESPPPVPRHHLGSSSSSLSSSHKLVQSQTVKVVQSSQLPPPATSHRRSRSECAGALGKLVTSQIQAKKLQETSNAPLFYQVISLFIPWGVLPLSLEESFLEKLSLTPLSLPMLPVIRGHRGALSIALPRNDFPTLLEPEKNASKLKNDHKMVSILRFCLSPYFTAFHLLISIIFCSKLVAMNAQKEITMSMNHFVSTLRERVPGFVDPFLMYFAEVRHEFVHFSRNLFVLFSFGKILSRKLQIQLVIYLL
jgi:hypothetical protein